MVIQEEQLHPPQRKRGRPTKSGDARYWSDDEIEVLIEIWSTFENLYNTKSNKYFNRDIRQKSLETIKNQLEAQNIYANQKQIGDKLTNLKNYYGSQKRIADASITSGAETVQSNWKFFSALNFLRNSYTPRTRTARNSDELYKTTNPTSSCLPSKMEKPQIDSADTCIAVAGYKLQKLTEAKTSSKPIEPVPKPIELVAKPIEPVPKDDDRVYSDLIYGMLRNLPECEQKDMMKLNIQQILVTTKYSILRESKNRSSVNKIPTSIATQPAFNKSYI